MASPGDPILVCIQGPSSLGLTPSLSSLRPSVPLEGKNQVWQYNVIPILVDLLVDADVEVQANAAGALMNAAVTTEGKVREPRGFLRPNGCRQEGRATPPTPS